MPDSVSPLDSIATLLSHMPSAIVARLVIWLWFGAAFYAGQQLLLQRLPPIAVPVIALGLTSLLIFAYNRVSAVRTWVDTLDLRAIVLLHVTRFVGVYFILLYRRGQLPYDFAIPAGLGDILVAALALPLAIAPLSDQKRLRLLRIWNVLGLVDILLVVFTAMRLNLADPIQMRAFAFLPLSLLPTFLVPLIIATHVVILIRLSRSAPAT